MNRRTVRIILLQLLVLPALIAGLSEIGFSQTKIMRNLKDYKEGKSLEDWDSRWGNAEESGALNHIHEYAWELWTKKELAYFTVHTYTRHGESSKGTYYIEKGPDGRWQVTAEWDRIGLCPFKSKQKCEEYRYKTYIYRGIEKSTDKDGKSKFKFVGGVELKS